MQDIQQLGHECVVGIDPSSKKLAWTVLTSGSLWCGSARLPLKKADPYTPNNAAVAMTVARELVGYAADLAREPVFFIEMPVVGRGGVYSSLSQAYVNGVVQAVVSAQGHEIVLVHPSKWKSRVVGKGSATKPDVAEYLRLRWPDLYAAANGDEDIIDSAAIALYGAAVVCGGPEVDAPRRVRRSD
jgi:Holliday junction resolvasome RuvABC endonuclease subunit